MCAGALQGATKALFVEGLQEVVERVRFESLDRVMIVGSGKDDDGRSFRGDLAKDSETV